MVGTGGLGKVAGAIFGQRAKPGGENCWPLTLSIPHGNITVLAFTTTEKGELWASDFHFDNPVRTSLICGKCPPLATGTRGKVKAPRERDEQQAKSIGNLPLVKFQNLAANVKRRRSSVSREMPGRRHRAVS
ncbi:MAG: hypothetical protein HY801_16185 [Candidatus Lindowbacteria bacterium]|nr:hypothetical protein [Candidatus Lindowbacteria bacterium]